MAKKSTGGIQNTTQIKTHTFIKGLNKDSDPSYIQDGMWTHARNATNSTYEGNLGTISNEKSNELCSLAGETLPGTDKKIIGGIHLFSDKWVIFTAAHDSSEQSIGSEVGLFEEDLCTYKVIVQDDCLNFSKFHLISGASREKEDCSWGVYFADGNNPDRYLNIGDPQLWPSSELTYLGNNTYVNSQGEETLWPGVQWIEVCNEINNCEFCENTPDLDCDATRLARLVNTPCIKVEAGPQGGNLRNGSYFVLIAYSIKGVKVTDYFSQSNVQPIWTEDDVGGALQINVEVDKENFDEFILVVVSINNLKTVAKSVGIYSTDTTTIYLDQIDQELPSIPLEQLPAVTPIYEKSDQIAEVNSYLLRVGPTTRFDFNYQPLANLIQTEWVSVEYPADHYIKGGSNRSYLRDEIYTFFIRWVYNTGDKSSSYHIPGRPPATYNGLIETFPFTSNQNSLYSNESLYEVINTASVTSTSSSTLDDGGLVIARGRMGYWESTERYPDDRPDIWNASYHCWTGKYDQASIEYDLCGQAIRHHKIPDNGLSPQTHHHNNGGTKIRILGVDFKNIVYPKDNEGNDIPGIVGYEILRGSREGNKSIIAKGMINNMRPYNTQSSSNRIGLYPNHPFNTISTVFTNASGGITSGTDLNPDFPTAGVGANDPYIKVIDDDEDRIEITTDQIPRDIVTFHSPDIMFRRPFLSSKELKIYGAVSGESEQQFIVPAEHPEVKLLSNLAAFLMIAAGIIEAMISMLGKRTINQPTASYRRQFYGDYEQNSITGGASGTESVNGSVAYAFPATIVGNVTSATNVNHTNLGGLDGTTDSEEHTSTAEGDQFKTDSEDTVTQGEDNQGNTFNELFFGGNGIAEEYQAFNEDAFTQYKGAIYEPRTVQQEIPGYRYLPDNWGQNFGPNFPSPGLGAQLQQALFYFSEGADVALRLMYALMPNRQYALQMIAHGFYDDFLPPNVVERNRFLVEDQFFIKKNVQDVPEYTNSNTGFIDRYRINNLKRQGTVVLRTQAGDGTTTGPSLLNIDNSLVTLGTAINDGENLNYGLGDDVDPVSSFFGSDDIEPDKSSKPFNRNIGSHYAGIKLRFENQYGQLAQIKQIPATPCEQKFIYNDLPEITLAPACGIQYKQKLVGSTGVVFGGDTYINRYTEKNTMLFFYNWLYGQPEGTQRNYFLYQMIPEPRFWMNSEKYNASDLWAGDIITSIGNWLNPQPGTGALPTKFYQLDNENYDYSDDSLGNPPGFLGVKKSYFYLSTTSVRDFFVESEVLVDFREMGDEVYQKVYKHQEYTDLETMFEMNPATIGEGNYYSYDYSLSVTKLFTQYYSQGNLQSRYYDPEVSKLCYTYYPDRIVYSLPQDNESSKDAWFMYLANNYKEFKSQISGVKNFAKTGIFMTFKNASPLVLQGVDTLQSDAGTEIIVGDGGLFAKPPQNVVVSDSPYEYGSSQNRLSVISTPVGLHYMSQNQGKIFAYGKGLKEISGMGMKWWFNAFLPYKLIEDFPNYPHTDNPVAGIGCQSIYNNKDARLYFCKKDYKVKSQFKDKITYNLERNKFLLDKETPVKLGDPLFFDDVSWTVSYNPANQMWISFHDWHPDLTLQSKRTFITTKNNGMWKHNATCQSYCNFYGVDYPFEIEIPYTTGQTVTTTRSIEYILECYRRSSFNCIDQYHVLDENFTQAVVYNSEQVSGYLNLNIYPKNNLALSSQYPIINTNSIDILFSKEENKYRFNQFWDITKDRGEFPINAGSPPTGPVIPGTTILSGPKVEQNIWTTELNGYIRTLNNANLDYSKDYMQRKKFRHYVNFLHLKKDVSGDVNMILKITNSKTQMSPR